MTRYECFADLSPNARTIEAWALIEAMSEPIEEINGDDLKDFEPELSGASEQSERRMGKS